MFNDSKIYNKNSLYLLKTVFIKTKIWICKKEM